MKSLFSLSSNALGNTWRRLLALCLAVLFFVPCMASDHMLKNYKEIVYYWKVKDGKKALARKIVANEKWQCSDEVLTPYKYDAKYGGKEAFKIKKDWYKTTKAYFHKDNDFFFNKYSIVHKIYSDSYEIDIAFAVKTNDGYGMIDESGVEVVPCKYEGWKPLTQHFYEKSGFFKSKDDWIGPNSANTYIQLFTKEGKWQLANINGWRVDLSKEYDYDEVRFFSKYWEYRKLYDNTVQVYSNIEYKKGFETFSILNNPLNEYIAIRKGDKWGIYDYVSNKEIVPCDFNLSSFTYPNTYGLAITISGGYFFMKKDGKRCIVNKKGQIMLSEKTDDKYPKICYFANCPTYVTTTGKKFRLGYYGCYITDNFYRWLGLDYNGISIVKEDSLYGLYSGKMGSEFTSCSYKNIYFDKDNTGFLTFVRPDGTEQSACLTADGSKLILLKNKSDIMQYCTVVSDKDGYTTYRLDDGYGFRCNATGTFTAPIFTPDTSKVENPQNIPLCQFYRRNNHGAFIGDFFFCPKYSRGISNYRDTLIIETSPPYIEDVKYIKVYWKEKVYKENGDIKNSNNWGEWNKLLNTDDTDAVYINLDAIFSDLGNIAPRGMWCYNYGLALCRKGNFEKGVKQLKRVKDVFGMNLVNSSLMSKIYQSWTDYAISTKEYNSALQAFTSACAENIDMDDESLKEILHDGPIYYAGVGDYESAMMLYNVGKKSFGIDEGNTFVNLVQSTYNLYLTRKERREQEEQAMVRQQEAERQAALQRQQQEAQQRYQERMQTLNAITNSLSNLANSISNVTNMRKGGSSSNRTSSTTKVSGSNRSTYGSNSSATTSASSNRKKVHHGMSTLRYTYDNWISSLIDMYVNYEKKYNDSERIKYQNKARSVRLLAEKYANCSVFKSKWEDWNGTK